MDAMVNFKELEELTKEYAQLKIQKETNEPAKHEHYLETLARDIIDHFSQPDFQFPLDEHVLSSNGKTTYVYKNNYTFQNLFEYLSSLLHLPIPIILGEAKFGPGEIIVNEQDNKISFRKLNNAIAELRKLVLAKRGQIV